MDALIQQQRLHHIVESYSLAGEELETFAPKLDLLVKDYPGFLIELALVEVLVQNWLRYPMPRGLLFLEQVRDRLQAWQEAAMVSSGVTPEQFEQITGLTPQGSAMLHAAEPPLKVENPPSNQHQNTRREGHPSSGFKPQNSPST
ncbi:MAG: hypothetical protein F6J95_011485 [Leptolyngbya sp. SIO1E4]|nr:hypothetical protein [Leptolyngbya sp. SIO1E4]